MMQIRPSPLKSTDPPVRGGYKDAETSCQPLGQPLFASLAPAGPANARAARAVEEPMASVAIRCFTGCPPPVDGCFSVINNMGRFPDGYSGATNPPQGFTVTRGNVGA